MDHDRVLQVDRVAPASRPSPSTPPPTATRCPGAMRAQLRDALADALADDAVRVVVLDHTGRVFCSGMDLKEAAGGGVEDQGVREFPELLQPIWSSPKPVVAVVRGPARAGGSGLLAACDVVVAGDVGDLRVLRGPARPGPGGDLRRRAAADGAARRAPADAHRPGLRRRRPPRPAGWSTSSCPTTTSTARCAPSSSTLAAGAPAALAETKRLLRARHADCEFDDLLELSARFFAARRARRASRRSARSARPAGCPPPTEPAPLELLLASVLRRCRHAGTLRRTSACGEGRRRP